MNNHCANLDLKSNTQNKKSKSGKLTVEECCDWLKDEQIQGISYWNGPNELALTDKDMQVRCGLKIVLECWDREWYHKHFSKK